MAGIDIDTFRQLYIIRATINFLKARRLDDQQKWREHVHKLAEKLEISKEKVVAILDETGAVTEDEMHYLQGTGRRER